MSQSVNSKKIKTVGWNSSVSAWFIEFAAGDVSGSPPSGGAANTFGFSAANADDVRAWNQARDAYLRSLPVTCDGYDTLLSAVAWERMKQINFAVPQ